MKIAVLLFGHLRTYEKCYKQLKKHLLDLYDCDVFMHTWSTTEANVSWQNYNGSNLEFNSKNTYEIKERLIKIYDLKDILIEDQGYEDLGNIAVDGGSRPIWATRCMLNAMDGVRKIKDKYAEQNNVDYDYVLFVRPDICLNSDFIIEDFTKGMPDSDLYNSFFSAYLKLDTPRVNDLRFICVSDVLFFAKDNVFQEFFDRKEDLLRKYEPDMVINHPPEGLLNQFVEDIGFRFYFIDFIAYRDFNIIRKYKHNLAQIFVAFLNFGYVF